MNKHPFQTWAENMANFSGVLACGVRLPNQSSAIKSFDQSFPEDRLEHLLQCLAEVAFTLRNSQLGGSRLRWVFEHRQLLSVRRNDGALAVLVMSRAPGDALAIEQMIAEFLAPASPAPETPGFTLPEAIDSGPAPDPGGVP
jgi:hypothetical protein